jgi:hypothetical protein
MSIARLGLSALALSFLLGADCGGGTPHTDDGGITQPPATAPIFEGSWRVADSDVAAAGFATLTVNADGTWSETGRTDDQPQSGRYTRPSTIDIDPSFGNAPAGMTGPYLEIDNDPNGDGEWVYGAAVESVDGSTLTMTLYAQRFGMGLRWATPATLHLVAN